jgi:hypothetical protein
MDKIVHLIMWIFVGALVVLVVTHAAGFSTAVTAVGGQVTDDASLLAGYAPNAPSGSTPAKANTAGSTGTSSATFV